MFYYRIEKLQILYKYRFEKVKWNDIIYVN